MNTVKPAVFPARLLLVTAWFWLAIPAPAQDKAALPYFGIRIVDDHSGRGVPLLELRTVNDIVLHTDSGGWVAFHEPGLMDREIYFAVSGPGYEAAKDGFGFRGVRLKTTPGTIATIKVKRLNIAERICRLTGQGIDRDGDLLGMSKGPNIQAGVVGQDSVQAVEYRGRIFWLWGDTNLPNYPLGNFQTTAATSVLPSKGILQGSERLRFDYFMNPERPDRVRAMAPFKEPGPVWLFGLLNAPDKAGKETLIAHFSRQKSLAVVAEHGLVRFDDDAGVFRKVVTLDAKESWRFPRGNAFRIKDGTGDHFYFAAPLAHTRVKATLESVLDPTQYEAWAFDPATQAYAWQRDAKLTTQTDEYALIKSGKLPLEKARYRIFDASTGDPVTIHGGSIAWSEYRRKWILIGVQAGGKNSPSYLGEVWYAEAESMTGPWTKAVKIASHPRYSFYNPRLHTFLQDDVGRFLAFEGTYTHTFSNNPVPTPRYDYNQLLYRLDLNDPRLRP